MKMFLYGTSEILQELFLPYKQKKILLQKFNGVLLLQVFLHLVDMVEMLTYGT